MAGTSSITMPSMVAIVGLVPAVDKKSVMFFVCFSRFGITKFVITEALRSSVIFKTLMASLHAGRVVVVHLRKFKFFCGLPEFSFRGKFIPKITIFRNLGALSPHCKSDNGEIWREGTYLGHPRAKFCKNRLRG